MLGETARGKVGKVTLDKVTGGDAMLGKVARGKVGKVVLDEVAHDEVGKATFTKIHARMGMWWRRVGTTFLNVTSSRMMADLKNCYGNLTLQRVS